MEMLFTDPTILFHTGGGSGLGLDAQLVREQPRELEYLPAPGPLYYQYEGEAKFAEDVPYGT